MNLVKQKGHEKPVKEAFERQITEAKMDNVNYEYFDFATECKAMRFDKVKILLDRMSALFPTMGYEFLFFRSRRHVLSDVLGRVF